jgi:putative DNA methylase
MTAFGHPVISPKKLIEVALPLDAINAASAAEKQPFTRRHPRSMHIWWARRPAAAARAVIFSQLVHDPEDLWRCQNPGKEPIPQNKAAWTKARTRLFKIIEELVLWENTTNETVLNAAREAIRESWRQTCELNKGHPQAAKFFDLDKMPGLHDPFAGGGAIPLEAQRLGLEAYASDLNPVAVLINKALIEIPPNFAGRPPVHPGVRNAERLIAPEWKGSAGLAEDVRRYGHWMRDEAAKRIGHMYPKVPVTKEMVAERPDLKPLLGEELTVIAWIWARTVKSPNPAFAHVEVPLATSFILSSKEGKEAYVQPVIERDGYQFAVKIGKPPSGAKTGTKLARGANFRCLMSGAAIPPDYIKTEAVAGRMGTRLMAIVAEGARGRIYLSPRSDQVKASEAAQAGNHAESIHVKLADDPRAIWCVSYGLTHYDQLFAPRQLLALTTLSDLVAEARNLIHRDAVAAGLPDDDVPIEVGGKGARAFAEGVSFFLALATSRWSDLSNTICSWNTTNQNVRALFARQAIPMSWDYVELAPFGPMGSWMASVESAVDAMQSLPCSPRGTAVQADASAQAITAGKFVSTDPPYYDNIGYADLSDFFYVWLRRSLKSVFPALLATIAVPKMEELVATPYRHGSKDDAEGFFLNGMTAAMARLAEHAHGGAPVTIYYAFKQSDTEDDSTNSTGWETFLAAVIKSGFAITGTWPMRTERAERSIGLGTNALASSIILVCRPRAKGAGTISRRQFVRMLNETLPSALDAMTRADEGEHSPVAPVDLSQAIIGPGMAIFSRYEVVLEADGSPMGVKTALQLINRFLAEDDFDADTQFCLSWFEQHGWDAGKFGEADTLARAKGTSVDGVKQAGVAEAGGGSVRLLRWKEYAADWDPSSDGRLPVWEALHQLIRAYNTKGDSGAAKVLAQTASKAEAMRQLAYRLYTVCERKGRADDARAYNEVVTGWTEIETAASKESAAVQGQLFEN